MSPLRWLVTLLSFAAAVGASAYVVWSSWPTGGASVNLPLLAHLLGGGAFAAELLARAWKIQLSARALHLPLGFGAALRVCLGGDFGAAITPARSGAEPARYLVLTEARVPAAGRLLILFAELFLEVVSLALVALGLALVFRGGGAALTGIQGLVGGYAAFVIGVGVFGMALARRNASGPPPGWAAALGLHAGRWRTIQRSLRQLRTSVQGVREARMGMMALALLASVAHVVARVLVLPGLVAGAVLAGAAAAPLTRDAMAPLVLWPLALQYGGVVAPAPGGGGFIEAAFGATLKSAIPARLFGASLIWWRVYTFYAYVALGGLAAGRTVLRALRQRRAGAHANGAAPDSSEAAPATAR
ncbi:lysylphosphatidylglycerol synthase domain-containing protein [Roseisolibacter sp. H3M3-2]|uniref:lysylphosphatidylglycerol synthase domain-containing protein n=1 Tax=Roseisolibacter sp. H3M3-2 TaxID=3031323 RepID=UPI0023DBB555|nr:lysylphosphatidylglycerol synthase domain-containing protein [Roseisolibacter sp. H3M3-2]MDF1505944.1 lysylphosphatidylglycerol synthase domain-containing protein [Roseisolibacter sp. H3M3-2]